MWSFKKPSIFSNTSKILPFEAPKSFACVGGVKKTGWVDTSNSYDLFISSLSGLTGITGCFPDLLTSPKKSVRGQKDI